MIDDWFWDFIGEHMVRHPGVGLPPLDSEDADTVYRAWRSGFAHRGIMDHAVATEASELLVSEAIGFPREHFPKLCELAVGIYKARNAAPGGGPDPNTRDAARAASKGCEHCGGGEGFATAYHPSPSHRDRVPESVAAHCVCPHGRWMRRRLGQQDADLVRRVPDLADVLARRSVWKAAPVNHGLTAEEIHGPAFVPPAAPKREPRPFVPAPAVASPEPELAQEGATA